METIQKTIHKNATITMNEETKGKIAITIKAENGETKEYKVTIQKVTDLGLESVKIDDNECTIKKRKLRNIYR